ncbi:hypothetical protein BDN71DRAFT_1442932, partial [Pleurotus eryngii]
MSSKRASGTGSEWFSYSFRDNQTVKLALLTPTRFRCRLSCQCVTVTYSFRPYYFSVSYSFRIQLNLSTR